MVVPETCAMGVFYKYAIKILVRKLKRTHGNVKNLVDAIKGKDAETACVKMEKTLDGRIQGTSVIYSHIHY